MTFSALVTVYYKDNPIFFEEALDSVYTQTITPSEVIIIADGPIGDTLEDIIDKYVVKYPLITKKIILPQNLGTGLAINEGLKYCTFDLVAKVDSDDINHSTRFARQLKMFEQQPELSIVGSNICEFINNDIDNITSYRIVPEKHDDIVKYAKKRCPLNQPSVMFRKSAIIASGGYKKFTFGEDYDLWVRVMMNGYKFYNIQDSLLYFRSSNDTIRKRGGLWYLRIDLSHHYDFYRMGFLTRYQFIYNIIIRVIIRLLPLNIRSFMYNKKLRTKA